MSPRAPSVLKSVTRDSLDIPDVMVETTVEVDVELASDDVTVSVEGIVDVVVYETVEDDEVSVSGAVELDVDSVSDDAVEVMLVDSDDAVVVGIVEVVETELVVDDVAERVSVGENDVAAEEDVVDVVVVIEVVEVAELVDDDVEVVTRRPAPDPVLVTVV